MLTQRWKPTEEELEIARKAIEDELIYRRDNRVSTNRNNGLVVKEYDSTPSSVIRMTHEEALLIAVKAILKNNFGDME